MIIADKVQAAAHCSRSTEAMEFNRRPEQRDR